MIRFSCPQCGKKFAVQEEMAGKNGKCLCGAVLTIPAEQPFEKAVNSGAPQDAMVAQDGVEVFGHFQRTCLKQNWAKQRSVSLLVGISIGILFVLVECVILFFEHGVTAAVVSLVFAVVGILFISKRIAEHYRRAATDKVTYEQSKANTRQLTTTIQGKVACIFWICAFLVLCVFLLQQEFAGGNSTSRESTHESLFATHGLFKVALLIVNVPVFILIGRFMVGSWSRYWTGVKWFFVPFKTLTKGWWCFIEGQGVDWFLATTVNLMCVTAYLVEYQIINLLFLR